MADLMNSKAINDKKLAEALVQAGTVAQLEADHEELNKKIVRFNVTV
jgi:hypothetical protein